MLLRLYGIKKDPPLQKASEAEKRPEDSFSA